MKAFHQCIQICHTFPLEKTCVKMCPNARKYFPITEPTSNLQQQLTDRFQDFHAMQPRIKLLADPLSASVGERPPQLQLELCELQSDPFFQVKRNERGISFWKLLPESCSPPQHCLIPPPAGPECGVPNRRAPSYE